jgi:hypothetical protein
LLTGCGLHVQYEEGQHGLRHQTAVYRNASCSSLQTKPAADPESVDFPMLIAKEAFKYTGIEY